MDRIFFLIISSITFYMEIFGAYPIEADGKTCDKFYFPSVGSVVILIFYSSY